jgi:hypothetical protein
MVLDFLFCEMGKRDLNAILYLNNSENGLAEWQNAENGTVVGSNQDIAPNGLNL